MIAVLCPNEVAVDVQPKPVVSDENFDQGNVTGRKGQ